MSRKKHMQKKFTIFTTIWHGFWFLCVYPHPFILLNHVPWFTLSCNQDIIQNNIQPCTYFFWYILSQIFHVLNGKVCMFVMLSKFLTIHEGYGAKGFAHAHMWKRWNVFKHLDGNELWMQRRCISSLLPKFNNLHWLIRHCDTTRISWSFWII
jgi:hypothetical protein